MKKLIVLSAAVVLTLASCGKKEDAAATEGTVDSTTIVTEEAPVTEEASATEVAPVTEEASATTAE